MTLVTTAVTFSHRWDAIPIMRNLYLLGSTPSAFGFMYTFEIATESNPVTHFYSFHFSNAALWRVKNVQRFWRGSVILFMKKSVKM